jgi:hypothetical protein
MDLATADPTKRGGFWPPGLGLPRTQLLVPIGAFEIEETEIDADDLLISQINGEIILHATRQIYARDSDFLYKMQHNSRIMRGTELLDDQVMARVQNK